MSDWWPIAAPDGAVALIAARCKRCYRIAGKYWEHDGEGVWVTRRPFSGAPPAYELFYDGYRVCLCDPSPALPEGDDLARLLARAHRKLARDMSTPLLSRIQAQPELEGTVRPCH